jgi:hypothetical protein
MRWRHPAAARRNPSRFGQVGIIVVIDGYRNAVTPSADVSPTRHKIVRDLDDDAVERDVRCELFLEKIGTVIVRTGRCGQ